MKFSQLIGTGLKFVKIKRKYISNLIFSIIVGKLFIPRRPWDEHDCKANAGQLLCKNKTNRGNLPLSRWKTMEISEIVRFQSLNFTSKPKGYLLQTPKLWEKLIVLNRRKEKSDDAKIGNRHFKLEKGKVC